MPPTLTASVYYCTLPRCSGAGIALHPFGIACTGLDSEPIEVVWGSTQPLFPCSARLKPHHILPACREASVPEHCAAVSSGIVVIDESSVRVRSFMDVKAPALLLFRRMSVHRVQSGHKHSPCVELLDNAGRSFRPRHKGCPPSLSPAPPRKMVGHSSRSKKMCACPSPLRFAFVSLRCVRA